MGVASSHRSRTGQNWTTCSNDALCSIPTPSFTWSRGNRDFGPPHSGKREGEIGIPSIVAHELYFGVYKSQKISFNLEALRLLLTDFPILEFDQEDARVSGELRSALAQTGAPLGPYDVLIAGQAKARDLTVITNNVREFKGWTAWRSKIGQPRFPLPLQPHISPIRNRPARIVRTFCTLSRATVMKDKFGDIDQRQIFRHFLLQLLVQPGALVGIDLGGGILDQLVDFRVCITILVGERHARWQTAFEQDRRRDRWIGPIDRRLQR